MRPLEWLCGVAVLLVLIALRFPQLTYRRRLWLIAALLPPLICTLHLVVEGWRTQMLPLYVLVVVVTGWCARQARWTAGRSPGKVVRGLLATWVIGALLLPGWVLPMFTLPSPTGPYPVGVVDRELLDAGRGRRLMVSIWYPAARRGEPAPLFNQPEAIIEGLAGAFGVPAVAPLLQHMRYTTAAASSGVLVADHGAPFPALIFSHGLVGLRAQNSSTLQELASWGYVVVAVDHTDAAAVTVFPDGERRGFDLQRLGIGTQELESVTSRLLPTWVADQRVVYDQLEQWAADDPLLGGRLDLERIGSFGHSFGGVTALEVCRVERRCRAAVDLDGGFADDLRLAPARRPVIIMTSGSSARLPKALAGWAHYIGTATAYACWLELPGGNHYSFTDGLLLSPLLSPPELEARTGLGVVNRYLRIFFDWSLRGRPQALGAATAGDPKVRVRDCPPSAQQ